MFAPSLLHLSLAFSVVEPSVLRRVFHRCSGLRSVSLLGIAGLRPDALEFLQQHCSQLEQLWLSEHHYQEHEALLSRLFGARVRMIRRVL